MKTPYDDIIDLPHHVSQSHKQMSMSSRAAQFAPFAALTGYGKAISETARYTDEPIELSASEAGILSLRLEKILYSTGSVTVKIRHFVPDTHKKGGHYVTAIGKIRRFDAERNQLILENQTKISLKHILWIRSVSVSDID